MKILKTGSIVKAHIPTLTGKLALGVVQSFQVVYTDGHDPYVMVWVEMLINNDLRAFELPQLEVLPRTIKGQDQGYVIELMKEAA